MQVLEKIACVHLDVRGFSGRKAMKAEDLKGISADQIPPDELASLGSKRYCDPKKVAVFASLRRRMQRTLETIGVRFLGGYAIPEERVNEAVTALDAITAEYTAARDEFLVEFDQASREWAREFPEWEPVILRAIPPVETIAGRLRCSYQVFRINPIDRESEADETTANRGLEQATKGILGQLYHEAAVAASDLWEKSLRGRNQVTQRIRRPLDTLIDKLDGLSFIDPAVRQLATRIEDCVKQLPDDGPITGIPLSALTGMVLILSDEDRIQAFAMKGQTPMITDEDDADVTDDETTAADDTTARVPEEPEVATPPTVQPAEEPATAAPPLPAPPAPPAVPASTTPPLPAEPEIGGWF